MSAALTLALMTLMALAGTQAFAHGVDDSTRVFLQNNTGVQIVPFTYIGARISGKLAGI